MIVTTDPITRKRLEDKRPLFMRCSHRIVFDSPVSPNLHMPYKIGATAHELIEPVRIQFYINDGLVEVVQHMIQLQMTWHVEQDSWMYLDHLRIMDPIIRR